MKRNIFLFVCVFLYFESCCDAAPSYGTRMPGKNQIHCGGQTYSMQDRDLEGDNGDMSSLQHFFLISYGLTDWFTVDFKGGAGDAHQTPNSGDEISYPAYMAGGYGFRIKIYDSEATKAVFGFQHISVHPYSVFVGNVKHKAVIDDWQLSLLASQDFEHITPYVGGRWSRMDHIHWVEDDRNRVKSDLDKSFGLIVGVDVPVGEKIWLNFEGQFLDVRAVAGGVNFAF